ncbi:hypothetical protein M5D96_003222 [Drosophila gunungcola]|uniref:Uncharacterized protein n=1 Tax=Drosophila gunungcola TaxID=103775 RepID=A0A9P9YRV6_9MUSC|nr:hypothetical protein M5D96_003222 [Drosophila gunungcola]
MVRLTVRYSTFRPLSTCLSVSLRRACLSRLYLPFSWRSTKNKDQLKVTAVYLADTKVRRKRRKRSKTKRKSWRSPKRKKKAKQSARVCLRVRVCDFSDKILYDFTQNLGVYILCEINTNKNHK